MNQELIPCIGYAFKNTITGEIASVDGRIVFDAMGSGPTNKLRNSGMWMRYAHASLIMAKFGVSYEVAHRMQNAFWNGWISGVRRNQGYLSDDDKRDVDEFENVIADNLDFFSKLHETKFSEQTAFIKVKVTGVQLDQ